VSCPACLDRGEVASISGHVLDVSMAQAQLYQRVARRRMEQEVRRIKVIGNEMGMSAREQIAAFELIRDVDVVAVPCPFCPEVA